jgi:ribosome-binding protein aMBF1 (putative translation factor)
MSELESVLTYPTSHMVAEAQEFLESSSSIIARFGASVRKLRFRLGISQRALADRADPHRTYIAGIERGARKATLRSIDRLARALVA